MARTTSDTADAASDMRALACRALELAGATVEERPDGLLHAALPPEWAMHFDGRTELLLGFSSSAGSTAEGLDLVLPGSYMLDRLIELVRRRGQAARAPAVPVHSASTVLGRVPDDVRLVNCTGSVVASSAEMLPCLHATFRLRLISDEVEEEIIDIVVDRFTGRRIEVASPQSWDLTPVSVQDVAVPAGLSPVAAYRIAVDAARESAGDVAAERQTEAEARLVAELQRLEQYFEAQRADLDERAKAAVRRGDDDAENGREETLAEFAEDRARREADLRGKFRVKVVLEPVGVLDLGLPAVRTTVDLQAGETRSRHVFWSDLVAGETIPPYCHACDRPTAEISLCAHQHICCPACTGACLRCGRDVCVSCGLEACHVCGERVCVDCSAGCGICGELVCTTHLGRPEDDPRVACSACARVCPACGRRYVQAPFVQCPECGGHVCAECIAECPSCGKAQCAAHIGPCDICGHVQCVSERQACGFCGQSYCAQCVADDGICAACRELFWARDVAPAAVLLLQRSSSEDLSTYRRWKLSETRGHIITVGVHSLRARVFVVSKESLQVVAHRTTRCIPWLLPGE